MQRGELRGRWGSPERTVVWSEPNKSKAKAKPTRKVAVVYYLCHRDGHLDHPHFLEMELPLSSSSSQSHRQHVPGGLYLRDFTARLNALRGSGMPSIYSWSCKRSYRNGYVWQDLAEDDLIHPAHGNDEYVLKGSPLLLFPQLLPVPPSSSAQHHDDASSWSVSNSSHQDTRRAGRRRKNWSSFDLGSNKLLMAQHQQCAATQTTETEQLGPEPEPSTETELGIDEISPPPSSGSPDPDDSGREREREVGVIAGGRMRASAVLMQLFSCGSLATVKRPGHARRRSDLLTASASNRQHVEKEAADTAAARTEECLTSGGGASMTERDYFSGSLVESSSSKTGGDAALLLKRSSSCNAERGALKMKLPVAAKEVRAGCLASRAGRAAAKKNSASRSTVAETDSRDGDCKAAVEPTAAGPSGSS